MSEQANLGLDLLVYIGENAIGGQRGASYEMSAESIDISTKTTGAWKAKIGGAKEWTAECEGVFFFNETGFEAAKTAFRAGTPSLAYSFNNLAGTLAVFENITAVLPTRVSYNGSKSISEASKAL